MFQSIFNYSPLSSIRWQSHTLPTNQDQLTQFQTKDLIFISISGHFCGEKIHTIPSMMSVLENVCADQVQLYARVLSSHAVKISHSLTVITLFWGVTGNTEM